MESKLSFALLSVFLAADVMARSIPVYDAQTFSAITNLSGQLSDLSLQVLTLNESLMWLMKVGLWTWGGICALVVSVCFFVRS